MIFQCPVQLYRKEKPGLMRGESGWLILTGDKLVFSKEAMISGKQETNPDELLEKLYRLCPQVAASACLTWLQI